MKLSFFLSLLIALTLSNTQLIAANYYWIGGTGDWSTLDHWATTSGGSIRYPQTPTANDNVFFDVHSFTAPNQVVTISVNTAFCRNMTWTGATNAPILRGGLTSNLAIFGSMTLIPNMMYACQGEVTFQGAALGNTITMGGQRILGNLNFDNISGEWIFQDSMTVENTVYLKNGILKTNNQALDALCLSANCATSGTLDLSNSAVILRGGVNYTDLIINPLNTKTVAGGSHVINCTSAAPHVRISSSSLGLNYNPVNINAIHFSNPFGTSILSSNLSGVTPAIKAVKCSSNAKITLGSVNIAKLSLTRGKSIEFEAGKTYKIDTLDAVGDCVSTILIKSSSVDNVANFTTSGTPTADYVTIQDIAATGNFTATNAVKLGNTTGWTLTERTTQTLYWVGGNGNWDDNGHWSFTSGGVGGACVPTAKDDVVFDQSSFNATGQKAIINVEDVFCRTMTWTNTLAGAGIGGAIINKLHIFGSFYLSTTMDWQVKGVVLFESETLGQEINTARSIMINDVVFNGKGGWILRGALKTQKTIDYKKGTWNTNSEEVMCEHFTSQTTHIRVWILGDSKINISSGNNSRQIPITATNMTLDAGRSEFRMLNAQGGMDIRETGVLRFYNLTFLNTTQRIYNATAYVSFNKVTYTNATSSTTGNFTIDTLIVGRHSDNTFGTPYVAGFGTAKITLKTVISPQGCDIAKAIFRRTPTAGDIIFIANQDSVVLNTCIIKGILAQGNMIVNNGRGLGRTTGWTIRRGTGRQLYWVNNGGDWFDNAHWSLQSGGVGGQCIPTDEDDVFFDSRSFTRTGQSVTGSNTYSRYVETFRNMDWSGVRFNPQYSCHILICFGNLKFVPTSQMAIDPSSNITFVSDSAYTIQTENQAIHIVDMSGKGIGSFNSQLIANRLIVNSGGLTTKSNALIVYFGIDISNYNNFDSMFIKLDNSLVTTGFLIFNGSNISLDAGKSTIQMEAMGNASITVQDNGIRQQQFTFYNCIFSNPTGSGTVRMAISNTNPILFFKKLTFMGNGNFQIPTIIDSLICSAGKTYKIDPTKTQTINKYFQLIGNNCEPIRLQSLVSGQKATVQMNSGVILADFVQMSDQKTQGTVSFFAGRHSTNIANSNTGWRFESSPSFINVGFLGSDTAFCNSTVIELKAFASTIAAYKWSTNATTPTITVNQAGEYHVEVLFGNNCLIKDTIQIQQVNLPNVNLGSDTVLCRNERLTLRLPTITGATYLWQDSLKTPQYTVNQAGTYTGEITFRGCKSSDSIAVAYIDAPSFNLGRDTTLCTGQLLNFDFSRTGATYTWQDGRTTPQYSINQAGVYWLEVSNPNQCKTRDSIVVRYVNINSLNIGADKTVCEGTTVTLKANMPDATFRWQDGSTRDSFVVTQSGIYALTASIANCEAKDTIRIDYKPLPTFKLGNDTTLCQGTTLQLSANAQTGTTYLWQDNSTSQNLTVNASGRYKVVASLNGCRKADSIKVGYIIPPQYLLGFDTAICPNSLFILKANVPTAAVVWSDKSKLTTLNVSKAGIYWADIVTKEGCTYRDSIVVKLKTCSIFNPFVPNVFSPNNDGINDNIKPFFQQEFPIVGNYRFQIYGRWGNLIFTTTRKEAAWDGTFLNEIVGNDVFVYVLQVTYQDLNGSEKTVNLSGNISVLR